MKAFKQTAKILDQKYNIQLKSETFERLVDSLDAEGKHWYRTAKVNEIAEWASGVLCNSEPDRNGNF
jgi:uncharacterized protein (DUF1778 family)